MIRITGLMMNVLCAIAVIGMFGVSLAFADEEYGVFPGQFGRYSGNCTPSTLGIASLAREFCRSQLIFDFDPNHQSCACIADEMSYFLNDGEFLELCVIIGMPYFQCDETGCVGLGTSSIFQCDETGCVDQFKILAKELKDMMIKCTHSQNN
jgi:hypothetical protein